MRFFKFKRFLLKWRRYEYWPWLFFYSPMVPFYFYYVIRARYFYYNTAANPGIELGGLFGESKIDILNHFSDDFKPKTLSHTKNTPVLETIALIKSKNMEPPYIVKPDVGGRGDNVVKTNSLELIQSILTEQNANYIIQEFIDYDYEFGVLYGRLPNETSGTVRSIVMKKFLSVTGDGQKTVQQLLFENKRAWFQIERLQQEEPQLLANIPAQGETIVVEHIGNHCRGTEFINANHLITKELHTVFDKISSQFEGFYYGRFDLKAKSIEQFQRGETIKIFELNGVTSEIGHIYDTDYSLIKAYRDIVRELNFVFKISLLNIKKGIKPYNALFITKLILGYFGKKKV